MQHIAPLAYGWYWLTTLADQHAIGQIDGVKGCFRNSGQMQIIFGTGVANKVYAPLFRLQVLANPVKQIRPRLAAQKLNFSANSTATF